MLSMRVSLSGPYNFPSHWALSRSFKHGTWRQDKVIKRGARATRISAGRGSSCPTVYKI